MNIQQVRIANSLLVAIIVGYGSPDYCWYIAVMQLSLEILNQRTLYLQQRFQLYNFILWVYSLVLPERLRTDYFSETTEWLINSAEHLFFGIVICLKVYIYTAVFSSNKKRTRWNRALLALLLFNLIGISNEIFQNHLCSRSLLVFIPDSIKDMEVNLLGAAVFMVAVCCRVWWLKYKRSSPANCVNYITIR
ncbi:MAG: hypothetical protein IPP72_02545 [Chitinophagaceae bacterium]|nr:hypothetical protein [Chitinophagaceae bacterium]